METENIGRLIAYVGAMGCGKTKKVIDLYEEMVADGLKVAIFKPFIAREGEDDEFVHARNGRKAPAIAIDYLDEIPLIADEERLQAILVDEVQFFEDEDAHKILEGIAMTGIEVYVFGLDVTSDNVTFGSVGEILAHADEVHKLRTACVKCGEEARISKFVGESKGDVVQVGDLDDYAPHCRSCYFGWKERLAHLKRTAQITLGGKDFYFSCDVDVERIKELGYDLSTIMQELNTIEKIMGFIAKIKKEE
jgi:thymidine kinase